MFEKNEIPEDWRQYQILFIDKLGKEKVRPISISSCVGKILERMINERLLWWMEKKGKVDKSQNGFRKGRGCAENLDNDRCEKRIVGKQIYFGGILRRVIGL